MEAVNSSDITMQALRANARGAKGWLKFLGILSIIYGALYALTIVGIIFAWMPIWVGIIMVKAGGLAGAFSDTGDPATLVGYTGRLKTLFTIAGIVTLISIALGIIGAIIGAAVGLFSGAMLPGLLEQYGF